MLTVDRLLQVLGAAHWSYKVRGFAEDRGGIVIGGPPGSLKSTIVNKLETIHRGARSFTDINTQGIVKLRGIISSGGIRTLVFPEMQKLYERGEATAANIEGTIRALTAEGFMSASFQSQQVNQVPARALIIGAMTTAMIEKHMDRWDDNGLNRRFLWVTLKFDNDVLENALVRWKLIPMHQSAGLSSPNGRIAAVKTQDLGWKTLALCEQQPGGGHVLQATMLRRIFSVLCWFYRKRGDSREEAWKTLQAFGRALARTGTELSL